MANRHYMLDQALNTTYLPTHTFVAISAYSQDDIRIVFKHEAIYQPGDHFLEELEFVVELLQFGNTFFFLGNITRPRFNFSSIRLQPEGSMCQKHSFTCLLYTSDAADDC